MAVVTETGLQVPGMVEETAPETATHFHPPARLQKCENEAEVNIEKGDLPQADAKLEWWYFNAHVKTKAGRHFSMFASFFRRVLDVNSTDPEREFCDTCTWALIDVESQEYIPDSLMDHRSCDIIQQMLDPEVTGKKCQHAEGPLLNLVKQKRLPRPDRLMRQAAVVAKDELSLDLDGQCSLRKRSVTAEEAKVQVAYELKNQNSQRSCSSNLTFLPQQSVVPHGATGEKGLVNNMVYYYIPRCSVQGTIFLDGEEYEAGNIQKRRRAQG
jgi:hypothetical protein